MRVKPNHIYQKNINYSLLSRPHMRRVNLSKSKKVQIAYYYFCAPIIAKIEIKSFIWKHVAEFINLIQITIYICYKDDWTKQYTLCTWFNYNQNSTHKHKELGPTPLGNAIYHFLIWLFMWRSVNPPNNCSPLVLNYWRLFIFLFRQFWFVLNVNLDNMPYYTYSGEFINILF